MVDGNQGAKLAEARRIWAAVLGELELQMTQATFDTWLRGSQVIEAVNGTWRVDVRHAYAVDWLDNRLRPVVERTFARHAPGVGIEFVGREQRIEADKGMPAEDGREAGAGEDGGPAEDMELETVVRAELVAFEREVGERIRKRGFSQLTNYSLRFWSELLGPTAFLCWAVAFANDRRDKRQLIGLSQPVRFSIARLARIAADGNAQRIRGVWRKCRAQELAGVCCGRYEGERLTVMDGEGVCRYWQPGAFCRLRAEQVGQVYVHKGRAWQEWAPMVDYGPGRGFRRQRYKVRVYMPLPLLTPAQVCRLDPTTQDEHERWLVRAGLDVEEWEALTVDSLGMVGLA